MRLQMHPETSWLRIYPVHVVADKGDDSEMRPLVPTSIDGLASDVLSKPEAIEEK